MMLLRFQDPVKLKTKRMVFEDVFPAHDSGTLEQLKELSSRRRVIEESINGSRVITEAIAVEMAGGLTSRNQQNLQKLELYLPLLENLVAHVHSLRDNSIMSHWISGLKIRWSTALNESTSISLGGPKFFRIDDLRFELGMNLFLYGAFLRERAFETLSEDLVESATLYRKAAGVYNYLANEVLPPLQPSLTKERPPEVTSPVSSVMSLICLAEAQAVTIKKAEERNGSSNLLAKLHYGVSQILDEASSLLRSMAGERNDAMERVMEFISSCSILHQLRSQRHLTEELASGHKAETAAGQIGIAVGVLRYAVGNAKRVKAPRNESWRLVFSQEMVDVAEMLRKLEHENEFVRHEKIPGVDGLPVLQGLRIVQAIPYEPQRWERQLCFRGVNV